MTSILTPVFVGLPLLYLAVRADRPHKTASILLIWFLHVPIYLFSLWSAKPVEFAREITLTILLNALLTILIVVTILLAISFLIWGAWRLSYVSLPKSRRKWMARPPSFRDLKIKIDAALSHAFFHMIAHPKVRRLLRDPNLRTHSTKDIGWLLRDKETYVVFCHHKIIHVLPHSPTQNITVTPRLHQSLTRQNDFENFSIPYHHPVYRFI